MQVKPPVENRDLGLDAARGIAILAVVAGHIFAPPAKTMIYVFHMPFFFVVGGYFFKPHDDLRALGSRFGKLIVPYMIFLLVFAVPEMVITVRQHGIGVAGELSRRFLLGGEKLVAPLTVFWFPTCYFFTVVIYNFLVRRLSGAALWGVTAILLALATANQLVVPGFWLPWAVNVCAMAVPLFHIGARLGHRIFTPSRGWALVFTWSAVLYLWAVAAAGLPSMNMKSGDYGIPLVTLFASIACIAVLAAAGRLAARLPAVATPLAYYGAASMTIMYVHMPVQIALDDAGLHGTWARFVLTVAICVLGHAVFAAYPVSRRFLLGQTRPAMAPSTEAATPR